MPKADRVTDGAGQDPDPHEAQRSELLEHLTDEFALQDALLERVAVDQQRGVQGAQAADAELVPCATGRHGQVGPAVQHVADGRRLVVWSAGVAGGDDADPQRAVATAAPPRRRSR